MAVTFKIDKYTDFHKQLRRIETQSETAMQRILSDSKKLVPGWIAAEAVKRYNLPKSEFTSGKIGKVKVSGNSFEDVRILYEGRLLTPTHFGMTPKQPTKGAYTLKASILKGKKSTLGKVKKLTKKQRAALAKNFTGSGTQNSDHSPIMLMPIKTKNKDGKDSIKYLPAQRKSKDRNDIEVIKTVSIAQMVSHDGHTLKPEIAEAVGAKLKKRIDHHLKFMR